MIIDFRFLGQNGGGMSSGDVQTLIEGYHYVNSGEVETQITEKGYLTSADTQIYLTSADTQNFLTSADTQNFVGVADFETATEVISTALNDLDTRITNIPTGSTGSSSSNARILFDSADTYTAEYIFNEIMSGNTPNVWYYDEEFNSYLRLENYSYELPDIERGFYGNVSLTFFNIFDNRMFFFSIFYDLNEEEEPATLELVIVDETPTHGAPWYVQSDGHIIYVEKIEQSDFEALQGGLDPNTAYYVVPDDPCSGMTQEECDCVNSGGTWENGECNIPIVISAQTDAMSSTYTLPLTGVSAVTDANFDFTNVATIADGDYPNKPTCTISNDSNGSRSSVKVVNITTSSVTTFDYAFNEMEELVSLSFDLTSATTAQNLYFRCPKLSSLTITFGDNPSVPSELNAGLSNGNCPALTNVQINGTFPMCDIKLFAEEYSGDKCSGLTSNSIDSIIAALPSSATGVTIYFGETVYNNMTQSQKNAIEDKGWTISVQEATCDDAENPDECWCQEDGGTWVDDGNGEGHCEGL